jgi:hypothetical protein
VLGDSPLGPSVRGDLLERAGLHARGEVEVIGLRARRRAAADRQSYAPDRQPPASRSSARREAHPVRGRVGTGGEGEHMLSLRKPALLYCEERVGLDCRDVGEVAAPLCHH